MKKGIKSKKTPNDLGLGDLLKGLKKKEGFNEVASDLKGLKEDLKKKGSPKDITLRIKKEFYDSIRKGSKKKEYRDFKPFYHKLFKDGVKSIKLHYQGTEFFRIAVKDIKVINTPRWLTALALISGFSFTDRVYEISLGKILN